MKKGLIATACCIALFCLIKCTNRNEGPLLGIWRLSSLEINGTVIPGNSLGNQLWEFNEEGGYMVDIDGAKEKGTYILKDKELSLKPVTTPNKEARIYTVTKLDSVELDLASNTDKNHSAWHFTKVKGSDLGEKD